jgi:YbbR domain-containing protein
MKGNIKKFFTTNPGLKLASLVLATLLWFFVVSQSRSVMVMDVPISFKNIPSNLEVVDGPKTVTISIEGQERLLKKLRQGDISVVIDLNNIKKGNIFLPLTAENILLPNMLTVTDISPQTLKLKVEEKVTKRVPVRAIIVGSPAQDFVVKEIKVRPEMIEIRGTESVVAKVYAVKTEPIDITGITGNLRYHAYVDVGKKNIKIGTPEVEVNIIIVKKEAKKFF